MFTLSCLLCRLSRFRTPGNEKASYFPTYWLDVMLVKNDDTAPILGLAPAVWPFLARIDLVPQIHHP